MSERIQNIYGPVEIGENVRIASFVEIGATKDHPTVIGDHCIISAFSFICPGTIIEENVFIGPRVTFTNDKYPPSKKRTDSEKEWNGCHVESNVSIGASVTILPGIIIGKNSTIAAGAVVLCDVPENSIYINKDKIIKKK